MNQNELLRLFADYQTASANVHKALYRQFNVRAEGLKVPNLTNPQNVRRFVVDPLASVGVVHFANEVYPVINNGPIYLDGLSSLSGTPRKKLEELIGSPDAQNRINFEEGAIPQILSSLNSQDHEQYARMFGRLYGYSLLALGLKLPPMGVRYKDGTTNLANLVDLSGEPFPMPRPNQVVELGCGLQGVQKVFSKAELTVTNKITMVDSNPFVTETISTFAQVSERVVPEGRKELKVVNEPMTIALKRMIDAGEKADLIIASMIHSAGFAEIEEAMILSEQVLSYNGYLAIQAPDQVQEGLPDANWMIEKAMRVMKSTPVYANKLKLKVEKTGEEHTGISAVFHRPY